MTPPATEDSPLAAMISTAADGKPAGISLDADIKRLMATSRLIKGHPSLGSESSIAERERDQTSQKSSGSLADTNLVIFGRGTLVSLTPTAPEEKASTNAAKKPSPTPTPRR